MSVSSYVPAALALLLLVASAEAQSEAFLGDPPRPPADVFNLPRGPGLRSVTGGFTVNAASREDVRSFYNAIYGSSEGIPFDSTANVAACLPGTNATAFREAVARRINWFRAMAGLPASITFSSVNNSNDQAAALIMAANNALSHFPPSSWTCWSARGSNAANNSNLALGNAGPDAVTAYIWDSGANNAAVGHRRWLLYPQTKVMGTGDIPAQSPRPAANAIWVFDGNFGGPRPATRTNFVAWPPPGFVPYPVVFGRWSFAIPGADFSGATVHLKSNNVAVAVRRENPVNGLGENTLVWIPANLDPTGATRFSVPATDTVWFVTVSNIASAPATIYRYDVTLFDPATPGPDTLPTTITGTNQPTVGVSNLYSALIRSNASGTHWRASRLGGINFFDGAENGLTNFSVAAATNLYAVRVSSPVGSGAWALHLCHTQAADQSLTLNPIFLPQAGAALRFRSRLGWATATQIARVQVSRDEGASWEDLRTQAGTGGAGEAAYVQRFVALSNFAGSTLRLRFLYDYNSGSPYFPQSTTGVGWYLDDISLTNTLTLISTTLVASASSNFYFNPAQTGGYLLEARPVLFAEFPLAWGPARTLTAVTNSGAPPVVQLAKPVVNGNQVRLDFTLLSGTPGPFTLLRTNALAGGWTVDATAVLTTNTPGSSYRFTTTTGGSAHRFYRVRSP